MYKKAILEGLISNNLLLNSIYKELEYRQSSMSQSFRRSLRMGKPSGHSHDDAVKQIVENVLKLPKNLIYED
jgi:hypothetical protein